MKAVRLTSPGGVLDLHEEAEPTVAGHDVLIRVHAASLNFRDVAILTGEYPGPVKQNGVLLSEGAGEVVAVGTDVTRVKVGDRVAANCAVQWIGGPSLPE